MQEFIEAEYRELTPEEAYEAEQQAIEQARIEEEQRQEKLQMLGNTLSAKLQDFISAREPIERRMLEDLRQYHGRYDAKTEQVMADEKYKRSKVFANITRSKTNAAEARISDMLFPADDKNWSIGPTPIPEIRKQEAVENIQQQALPMPQQDPIAQAIGMMGEQGGQMQVPGMPAAPAQQADPMAEQMKIAKKAAQGMTRTIEDQLTEAQYNIHARRAIHQAAVLGTGILKGPVIVSAVDRKWRKEEDPQSKTTVRVLEMSQRAAPSVEWVDTWNFFPDLSAKSIDECESIYERKFISRRQLKDLAKRPGYMVDQIKKILEHGPKQYATSSDHLQKMREIAGVTGVVDDSRYELWEYHGPLETDDLRACGCEVEDDDLEDYEAVVMFIGDHVIFADLNPMETGDRPYCVWNWEEDETCLFGYGVPYLMRTPQRVLNAAWRMMMDNSGAATGPQLVVKNSKIKPANNDWAIEPMKLWFATDPNTPVNDAFAAFDINSHQSELANILQLAKTFADEETSLPMIAQGERGTAPDTATGMSMLMNAANVVLRRMVKAFDDFVTKPMITRFYDWNMQFGQDEEIKGDFKVDARGTTALLVKELQSQQLLQFAQFYAHPAFGPVLGKKAPAMIRRIAESLRLSPDEVVPTDEELEAMAQEAQAAAQQQQPQDPRLQVAQMRAEAEMKRAEYEAAADQTEMQVRQQLANMDYQYKIQALELERDIEMLKLASTKELTLEQIKAKLAETSIKENSRKQLFAAEQELKLATGSGI